MVFFSLIFFSLISINQTADTNDVKMLQMWIQTGQKAEIQSGL
jgi:hypothetical protein